MIFYLISNSFSPTTLETQGVLLRAKMEWLLIENNKSQRWRHMWVEFVVGSPPCFERFFSRYSRFLLSTKTNIFKFQLDHESGRQRTSLWMCYLQIITYYLYLFIYPLYFFLPSQHVSHFCVFLHTDSRFFACFLFCFSGLVLKASFFADFSLMVCLTDWCSFWFGVRDFFPLQKIIWEMVLNVHVNQERWFHILYIPVGDHVQLSYECVKNTFCWKQVFFCSYIMLRRCYNSTFFKALTND